MAELASESGIGSGHCSAQQLAVEPGLVAAASAGQVAAGVQVAQSTAMPTAPTPARGARAQPQPATFTTAKGKTDTAK